MHRRWLHRPDPPEKIRRAIAEPLEDRRLLCALHIEIEPSAPLGPLPAHSLPYGAIDHDASWYEPVGNVTLAGVSMAVDPLSVPMGTEPTSSGPLPLAASFPVNAAGLPLLSSRANNAGLEVFLDFDGWSTYLPFDNDGDPNTYSAAEQEVIYRSWIDVVSFFSPLDVNITTIQPPTGASDPNFAWQLNSPTIVGAYASVGALSKSGPRAWNNSGSANSRRSAIAHELGHVLSLHHQSEYDKWGNKTAEYSGGWDDRNRPIMGVDYLTNVRTWFYGRDKEGVTVTQDGLLKMADLVNNVTGGDGFRPDDYGNSIATAFNLSNSGSRIEGFLERYTDVDMFTITPTSAGTWNFGVTPMFESAVEPKLELLDSTGAIIAAQDDADQRGGGIYHNAAEFSLDLAPGTYYMRLSSSGDIAELGNYLLTASPIMNGWRTQDISNVFRPGTSTWDPSTNTIIQTGGGGDAWGSTDQFRFTHNVLNGDGSITVRVDSVDPISANSRAGLVIRESLASNARSIYLGFKSDGSIENTRRTSTGGSTASVSMAGGSSGSWIRISRSGNSFTLQRSADGSSWTTLATTSLTMSGPVYMGLITHSQSSRYATTAAFSGLSTMGDLGDTPPSYNALPSVSNLTAAPAAGANTSIVLNWADIAGETGYAVQRSANGIEFSQIATVAANATNYTDVNVWGSMRWFYRIVSLNGSTGSVPSAPVSTINKPNAVAAPSTSYAQPYITPSTTQILLNWTDVQGDAGYRVERSTDNVNFSTIATTQPSYNTYNDSGRSANTTYYYRITPITSIGDGLAPSFTITATTRLGAVTNLMFTGIQSNSISMSWTDISGETGYRVERSNDVDGSTFTAIATLPADTTSWTDNTVSPVNEYYYRVIGTNALTQSTYSAIFTATPPATALPVGWENQDLGTVTGPGTASLSSGTWTLFGTGSNIGGTSDTGHIAYRTLAGDGEITARVATLKDTSDTAEAGVIIRESLAANSRFAMVAVTIDDLLNFDYRSSTGGSAGQTEGPDVTAPYWVRLNRTGNVFTAYYSSNGTSWTQLGQQTISMATNVYMGLAVSSRDTTELTKATFTSLAASGNTWGTTNTAPTITTPAVANPSPVTNKTSTLSVVASDDGGAANLTYTWSVLSKPAGAANPTFSVSGTNGAASTLATFSAPGGYSFRVTVQDAGGLSVASDVSLNVNVTPASIAVTSHPAPVNPGDQVGFSATVLDQFNQPITPAPAITWSASKGTIDASGLWTAPFSVGLTAITAASGSLSNFTAVQVNLAAVVQPFNADHAPQQIRIAFNGNVSASLGADDLVLVNLSNNQPIQPADMLVGYDTATNIATVTVPTLPGALLPDGTYQFTLPAGSVNGSGNPLPSDVTAGFFVLSADGNRDQKVDTEDFNLLAGNFGGGGRTFSQGNFDYDPAGMVDSVDFNVLLGKYGTKLPTNTPGAASPLFGDPVLDGDDPDTWPW